MWSERVQHRRWDIKTRLIRLPVQVVEMGTLLKSPVHRTSHRLFIPLPNSGGWVEKWVNRDWLDFGVGKSAETNKWVDVSAAKLINFAPEFSGDDFCRNFFNFSVSSRRNRWTNDYCVDYKSVFQFCNFISPAELERLEHIEWAHQRSPPPYQRGLVSGVTKIGHTDSNKNPNRISTC